MKIYVTIISKRRATSFNFRLADAAYMVGTILCVTATGVMLAWRG